MLAAACGSAVDNGGPYGGMGVAAGVAPATGPATVMVKHDSKLGDLLTDGQGRVLYLFEADRGTSSMCANDCASVWPALTTNGGPQAGTGASAALIGTAPRGDGQTQLTYGGHPLYYYVGDNNPGDTNGEGLNQFGGGWDVVSPQGNKIESAG
jgi:predicted lipoprotein with Yx(FWY)xxD motif